MIVSVSRRTDVPAFYSDWFYKRIEEGYVYTVNPFNPKQISKISLSRDVVDCFVFWTKNPLAMMGKLDLLEDYMYYFQFTITGYGKDIEPNLPSKREVLLPTFMELSRKIGKDRMVLRYDPILLTQNYTKEYHIKAFEEITRTLKGYTTRVVISFVDLYAKIKSNMKAVKMLPLEEETIGEIAKAFAVIAKENDMSIESCSEVYNLTRYGIKAGACVDQVLIEQLTGLRLDVTKDLNQRKECGCVQSIDIGVYNTCLHGCKYCYANYSNTSVANAVKEYEKTSPLLCRKISEDVVVKEKHMKSLFDRQLHF